LQWIGVGAALLSALASGLTPIFGKQAYADGTGPITVVLLRTLAAAAVLWALHLVIGRQYIRIYPVGLVACLAAGLVNGAGSVLFYTGLAQIDASLAQLLFTLQILFLTLFSWLDGNRISPLTWARVVLGIAAVVLLKWTSTGASDWTAAALVIGGGGLYALHVWMNQRSLYDIPAPTVTLYTLTGMSLAVVVAQLIAAGPVLPRTEATWTPILLLAAVTISQRLTMFVSIKQLGGPQTMILHLAEAMVTIIAAALLLNEQLTNGQWLGAALLAIAIALVTRERHLGELAKPKPWVHWLAAVYDRLTGTLARAPHRPASLDPAPSSPSHSLPDRLSRDTARPAPVPLPKTEEPASAQPRPD
jgi:drug/metabolite transporter (DMT)-like permease